MAGVRKCWEKVPYSIFCPFENFWQRCSTNMLLIKEFNNLTISKYFYFYDQWGYHSDRALDWIKGYNSATDVRREKMFGENVPFSIFCSYENFWQRCSTNMLLIREFNNLTISKYFYFYDQEGITMIEHLTKSRVIIVPLMLGERKCWGKKCIVPSFAHVKMFVKDVQQICFW
jgi:hypothetical protein